HCVSPLAAGNYSWVTTRPEWRNCHQGRTAAARYKADKGGCPICKNLQRVWLPPTNERRARVKLRVCTYPIVLFTLRLLSYRLLAKSCGLRLELTAGGLVPFVFKI